MVVEYLTFVVPETSRAAWLEVEEHTWSRFLERQPGFVAKQMWTERGDAEHVHAVIWWESEVHWQAVDSDDLKLVDAAMGEFCVSAALRTFDVVRAC
jgi:uncharacterized protein (TIGR03792 family)